MTPYLTHPKSLLQATTYKLWGQQLGSVNKLLVNVHFETEIPQLMGSGCPRVAPTLLFMSAPQGVGSAPAHGVRQLPG
jgi:hypothetical protein